MVNPFWGTQMTKQNMSGNFKCRARVPTGAKLPSTPGLARLSHHDSLLGVRMARRLGNRRRDWRLLRRHRIHLRRVRGAYRVP